MALRAFILKFQLPLAIAFFSFVVAVSIWRTSSLVNVPGSPDPDRWGLHDFRDAIYYPCLGFANGENPYRSSEHIKRHPVGQLFPLYSPLTLVIHQPFCWLSHSVAQWVYFSFTIGLCLLLAWLIQHICRLPQTLGVSLCLAGCLLICRPGHMNLALGQSTLQAVLFTVLALYWSQTRPVLSGVFLALATFKPTFGVPLFLLMVARRDFRAAAYGLAIGCVITLPLFGYLIWLEGGIDEFINSLREASSVFDAHHGRNPQTSFSRIDAFLLWGKLTGTKLSGTFEYGFALAIILMTSAALFYFRGNAKQRDDQTTNKFDISKCLILMTMIVAIYHHAYDWLLLALPVVWLGLSADARNLNMPKLRGLAITLLCFPAINFASSNSGKAIFGSPENLWLVVTSLNSLAMIGAWFVIVLMFLKQQNRSASKNSESVLIENS